MRRASLRLRLFAVILTPLLAMALIVGFWRVTVAQQTAQELFDRSLLSAALAISRDVAVSEGDVLSLTTRDLIGDAAGGEVFYHATGPGGIYVTGYAYPPTGGEKPRPALNTPHLFQAIYRDEEVRVLQVTERLTIDTMTGDTTVTVWQRLTDRNQLATQLAIRAAALIGVLLATLALVVWFGVGLGLRPLLDLEEAIAVRSPDDLSRIKRPVPIEANGIVRTLNRLLGQVEASIDAHQAFISDAAHQLRNPAAAVQSMAESVRDARSETDRNQRISELIAAARSSARVADQLLSLDRLQHPLRPAAQQSFDLTLLVRQTCADMGPIVLKEDIDFGVSVPDAPVVVQGDPLFVTEAIKNLIDNALKHGGKTLSVIKVALTCHDGIAQITVEDNGKGLIPEQADAAFRRFSQIEPSEGSGLGLAIVSSVAERHGGHLSINRVLRGASLTLSLPAMAT
ncbi:Sensor protein QseC [Falsiruegeria litorea R37]|uniref:histidine kinase n=1 Tax=Falsiruegeria litorea R37 TaxID=1200284 RepID=A0A1Y5SB55_9RHOB|nr:sensor histidine kinase [Falsiruegeria litorea]SLN35557.1 Sensor protein QseC [Falsiruegeria litorea R37]